MRLFIATPVKFPLYGTVKNALSKYIEGKWVEGWNLHLTHKFIGDDDPQKYKKSLLIPDGKIKIKGLGTFGEKVLFLKAEMDENVNELINKTFSLKNDKPFKPHVTLCRIKHIKDGKFFDEIKKFENIELEVPLEVYLYKSTLTKKGPVYEKIYRYK